MEMQTTSICKYTGRTRYHLCLIAISGDMAKGGMVEANRVRPFDPKYDCLVRPFLEAQLAYHMEQSFQDGCGFEYRGTGERLRNEYYRLGTYLIEVQVFHHKWDLRTRWELAYMSELDEIERYKPFVIESYKGGE